MTKKQKKKDGYLLKLMLGITILAEALLLTFIIKNVHDISNGRVAIIDQQIKALDDNNYFMILTGKDKAKREVWSFSSNVYKGKNHDTISKIKAGKEQLYIVLNKVLYCLDRNTGKELWKAGDMGRNNCIALDAEENIYVTDYNKPSMKIINCNGEVLKEEQFDKILCWPTHIDMLKDKKIKIYFENVKNKNEVNESEIGYDNKEHKWFVVYNTEENVFENIEK